MFTHTKFKQLEHKGPLYTQQFFWYSISAMKLIPHFIAKQGSMLRCLTCRRYRLSLALMPVATVLFSAL